jgi:hypothetical protein
MVNKTVLLLTLGSLSLALITGYSVVGVIQSTERVGTSGIVVQPPPPLLPPPPSYSSSSPPPPPPEPTIEIDIYSDAACTQLINSINWGEIEVGGSVKKNIYVKNSGDQGIYLSLLTQNWTPSEAADDMQLLWDYDDSRINPDEEMKITLTLAVSSNIQGIDTFNFDIVLVGSPT